MNKKLFVLLGLIILFTAALIPAFADDDDDDADGVWCYTPDIFKLQEVSFDPYAGDPETQFLAVPYFSDWSGTFAGTSIDYGLLVAHSFEPFLFVGTVSFVGEVDGVTGGLEMDVMGDRPDLTSDWVGTWKITKGTGDLENFQGHGTFWGPGWQGDLEECGVIYYAVTDMEDNDDDDDDD